MHQLLIPFIMTWCIASAKMNIPEEVQDYINELHDYCLAKMGLTEEDHQNYDIKNRDPKMMCYLKCLMLQADWMNSAGVIDYDHIRKTAHPQVAEHLLPALNKCTEIEEGTHECEKAYNFNTCLLTADPENWFLV